MICGKDNFEYSISKKEVGKCACCGESYGTLVLDKTGDVVSSYSDCTCHDGELAAELEQERESFGPAFVV